MTSLKKSKTAVVAGLTAAILDMSGAIIVYCFILNLSTPQRVVQSVAAGLLGKPAYAGGTKTVMIGLVLHTLIALSFSSAYVMIQLQWRKIFVNKFVAGVVYGCLVWSIMNFLVLPLIASKPFVFHLKFTPISLALIVCCVGIPIAIITDRLTIRKRLTH